MGYIFTIAVVALGCFWIREFARLMVLERAAFPGEHDRAIWGAAFIVLPMLTPFAFIVWAAWRKNQTN
jgi:hypothetical protein